MRKTSRSWATASCLKAILAPVDEASITPAGKLEIGKIANAAPKIASENPARCELGALCGWLCLTVPSRSAP